MVVATMLIGFILVSFQWVGAVGPGAHRVTNLTNKAFTVSWTSEALEAGTIEWGTTVGLGNVSIDDRGAVSGRTHHVTVGGLLPATTYFYDVVSGSATDDNEGAHFTVTTGPTLGGPGSDLAYGKVFRSDGLAGAPGCLVYVQVQDADGQGSAGSSLFFSALSEGSGLDVYWNINLGTVREQGGASFFTYAGDDTTAVEVDCGGQASVSLSVPTSDDSPAPDVVVASASDPGPTLTPTPVSSPSPTFAPPPPGSLGGGGAAAATPTPVSTVNMGVAITGWPETISAGGEVTFGVVVTNNGGKSATDIVVTNSLPLRAHFTSGTPDCIESRSSVVTCKVDFLNPGDEARMSISFLASATAVPGTTLTNLATVTSTQPDSDPSDNAVAVSAIVVGAASVSLSREVGAHEIVEFNAGEIAPLSLLVDAPAGGSFDLTIKRSPASGTSPAGYNFEGFPEIVIDASLNPTLGEPLSLVFMFALDEGAARPTHVFRNRLVVPRCSTTGVLDPDPCVSEQTDVRFAVLTSAASTWNFGVADQLVPTPSPTSSLGPTLTPTLVPLTQAPTVAPGLPSDPSPTLKPGVEFGPTQTPTSGPSSVGRPTLAPAPIDGAELSAAPISAALPDDAGGSILPWVIAGIALAVVVGGAGLLPLRRRR